jgi:CHAT domain-containing protein
MLNGLAELAATGNDLRMAEDYYKQALNLRLEELTPNSPTRVESLAGLASVMRHKGHWTEAAQLLEQALSALEYETVHLGGTLRQRTDFRARHAGYYRDYIDVLIEQKKPELAFSVLERSRAQSLLEMLAKAHVDIRQGADPALLARERSLRQLLATKSNRKLQLMKSDYTAADLTAVMKDIQGIIEQYHELEEKLQVASPSYAALTRPRAVDEKQVQEHLLGDNTLLLEYSLGDEHSYVWAITTNSFAAYELPNRAEIERVARRVRDILTVRNYLKKGETDLQRLSRSNDADAQYPAAAAALSRMVLGPVVPLLGDKRLLLVVSDGMLQYIPFAALPLPRDVQGRHPASWVPLIRDHEVVNLPSASVLAVLKKQTAGRAQAAKIVAVLADPVFDAGDARVHSRNRQHGRNRNKEQPQQATDRLTRSLSDVGTGVSAGFHLSRLPFTRREAQAILKVTPAGQGMSALDFNASRATAFSPEISNYRIVHFATHGLLNSEHPELSGLVLSLVDEQGKEQNGFLGLEDIYNLNLHADLVVLSACESGLGKDIQGEGLVGIARGFMYAGAPSVVASLWKVDDLATAELMKVFYKGMLNDKLRPAAALRRAQIAMSRRWPSPYYWAGFVLQGQP